MNRIVNITIAIIAGCILGSAINMGIIMVSDSIIPVPPGVDNTTVEGLKASMHLFEPKHFIFPFLAHAIGTLAGAFITSKIAVANKLRYALVIGCVFLAGGITNVVMLPSPLWFSILDLAGAYLPMAWLGWKLEQKI